MIVAGLTAMGFTKNYMVNQNAKATSIMQSVRDINKICIKFQDSSGASNTEVKCLLMELASLWVTEEKNKFGFR